ncbi:hypothetical protein PBI_PAT3_47 [Mycobacterium phage Pat3]|nr:hypothetical protein PBI_PAT3_47 [Mycobacterium phage Pat3]
MTVIHNDIYELVRLREMHREIQRSGLNGVVIQPSNWQKAT